MAVYLPGSVSLPATLLADIPDRSNRGLIVCGTPVGTDDYVKEEMQKVTDKHSRLHEQTRKMTDAQCQHILLRFCTCQNLNHWMRTVRPDLMQEAADAYDEESLTTLQRLLWCTADSDENTVALTELQIMQVRQHCKLGGLGLSSTALIKSAAYLASWTQTKTLIKSKLRDSNLHNILDTIDSNPHGSLSVTAVADAYSFISSEFARAHKQLPEINCLEVIKEHAQRHYADAILKNLKSDMLAEAGDRDRARILSCAGPKASSWLNCIPKVALFKLGPADFRVCLRLRLGLEQPCVRAGIKCKCGTIPDALGVHYLTCSTGNHLQIRHEVVCKAAHEMVRAADKESQIKGLEDMLPGFRSAKGYRLVLDQLIQSFTSDGMDVGIDFAVCHPCAVCYLPQ